MTDLNDLREHVIGQIQKSESRVMGAIAHNTTMIERIDGRVELLETDLIQRRTRSGTILAMIGGIRMLTLTTLAVLGAGLGFLGFIS